MINLDELKVFLDEKFYEYNHINFIKNDPIQIPHQYNQKEDIEISAFLVATIAWGNRKSIINNGYKMMGLLDNSPFDFIQNHSKKDLNNLDSFKHRTFNGTDFKFFIRALKHIYIHHGGIQSIFYRYSNSNCFMDFAIHHFKKIFFEIDYPERTTKHISDPLKNSAAKRINMFLRWMVRNDTVDFGIWDNILPSKLSCPLDIHSGNIARKLGILQHKQNDAKALMELNLVLRKFDPVDPVKYDFALFGLGVSGF